MALTILPVDQPVSHLLTISGDPSEIAHVRALISEAAAFAGFSWREIDDIVVAAGEAINNAVLHGSPHGACDSVRVVVTVGDVLSMDIFDSGPPFTLLPASTDPEEALLALAESGRGIPIMRALLDYVDFRRYAGGNHVRLVKHRTHSLD